MGIDSLLEIFHKPSAEEIRSDLDRWAGTLLKITTGKERLEFSPDELILYNLFCVKYLGQKIAGDISPRNRDRPTIDVVTEKVRHELDTKKQELGWDNPEHNNRFAFIERAANLITANVYE